MADTRQLSTAGAPGVLCTAGLLRMRAEQDPERVGYTFLADGESCELTLSYAELDRRASAIAAGVAAAGARPGDRAILLMPPGFDYIGAFFGCLYAGLVAVPAYPPNPVQLDRSLPRLLAIVRDAGPSVALTIAPFLAPLAHLQNLSAELGALRWLAVDELPAAESDQDPVRAEPEAIAMLQYTSGSTATPKGVMLSHGNLLHNLHLIQGFLQTSQQTRGLIWLPPYHDMGLIGGLLQPLFAGCPVTLMSPLHFLERPMRWLEAMQRFHITASGGPNFAYELCARRATPEQIERLDLSSWQVAFCGAEPVRPQTLARFASTFRPAGFRPGAFLPCYGLAEATLIVSGIGGLSGTSPTAKTPATLVRVDRAALSRNLALPARDAEIALVDCGQGAADQQIAIVDPMTFVPCAPEQVGEIWVSGPSVAKGYWGKPGETDEVFRARIAGEDGPLFLRTGDLGFLHNNHLVVTGRLKDVIIMRGRNYYPQDIEYTAEQADPVLRRGCSAAFQLPADAAGEHVATVHELQRNAGAVDVVAVAGRVRQEVAREHGIQVRTVVLIRPGGIPKTSSGKVQRRLCRSHLLDGALPEVGRHDARRSARDSKPAAEQVLVAAPPDRATLLDGYLRGALADLVGVEPPDLDEQEPLLSIGLDSLAAVQLKHQVESDLGLELPLGTLLEGATLAEMVGQLSAAKRAMPVRPNSSAAGAAGSGGADFDAGERVAPMSRAQRWIWLMQKLEPESTASVIATAFRLHGSVDSYALRRALDALVARHPVLRTTFEVRGGEPSQIIRSHGRAAFAQHDVAGLDDEELGKLVAAHARRSFDLDSGPLLRADLYQYREGAVLLLAAHHIITDFWSSTLLAHEVGDAYSAYADGREFTLPPPRATYLDVVEWRASMLADPAAVERVDAYWAEQLSDAPARLALEPKGGDASRRGGASAISLPVDLTRRLHQMASSERVTMYVVLLAAFQAVLHLTTGQADIVLGAALAGRTRPEFADVVGCCTTTAVIRSRALADEPFRDFLTRTRSQVIGALAYQDYPMLATAERYGAGRRGSVVDVLFAFNRSQRHGDDLAALATVGPPGVRRRVGGLEFEAFPLPLDEGELPIEVVMAEVAGAMYGVLRHRAGFLGPADARRMIERFTEVLERAAEDPATPVSQLLPPR